MWKKGSAVFQGDSSSYLGVATDLRSNLFEAQKAREQQQAAPPASVDEPVAVVAPLELKVGHKKKRSKSVAEHVSEAAEADNVYERLLEKAQRYAAGEGDEAGLVDHERKRHEAQGRGRGQGEPAATTALQEVLSRVPALAMPAVGRADVEEERARRRERLLAVCGSSGRPLSGIVQSLLL